MKPLTSMTLDEAAAYRRAYAEAIHAAALLLEIHKQHDACDLVLTLLPREETPPTPMAPWEIQREYCS